MSSVASKKYSVVRMEAKHIQYAAHALWERLQFFDEFLQRKIVPLEAPTVESLKELAERGGTISYVAIGKTPNGSVSVGTVEGFTIAERRKNYLKILYLEAMPDDEKRGHKRLTALAFLLAQLDEFLGNGITGLLMEVDPIDNKLAALLEKAGYTHADDIENKDGTTLYVYSKHSA